MTTENNHSVEVVHQIWNDKLGSRIEIGPDADSLGLTEIRHIDASGKTFASILLNDIELIHLSRILGDIRVSKPQNDKITHR